MSAGFLGRNRGFFGIIALGLVTLASDGILNQAGAYEICPYYDTLVHTAGGLFASLLYLRMSRSYGFSSEFVLLHTLAFVALIGVLWEFYEFIRMLIEIRGAAAFWESFWLQRRWKWQSDIFYSDTIVDLFCDLLGGTLSLLVPCLSRALARTPRIP
jgi:hypothetical protein